MKFIEGLPQEFGQSLARVILEAAAHNVGDHPSGEAITIPLNIKVSEVKALSCIDISVNGVHIGHVGVKL
ncbi:hypothetical protein ACIPZ8_14845 [Pseudomonas sp. NPDC089422]|uniref:hypothetical protein n=1 Tax=Pseudomonas sp. NPDC089422 TaxID=3364466 RepID=UPI0038191E0C